MTTLERRIAELEKEQVRCECSGGLIVGFAGEQLPHRESCPIHGNAQVIDWPLAKSKLDIGSDEKH
jgi:hypothetical protein